MHSSAKLIGVGANDIDSVWDYVRDFIVRAIQYSDSKYSLLDVYRAIQSQDMQLWLITQKGMINGVCVTEIIRYPQEKRLCIVFVSGVEMDDWLHLINEIMAFAKYHQCQSVELYGRPGWEKKLKQFGYEKIHTVLRANLSEVA